MQDYTKPVTELATILITSSNFKDIDTESRTLGLERSSEPHVAYSAATVDRDQVEFMQDDPSSYYYEQMKQPDRSFGECHAIFGTLKGQGLIERYSVYRRVTIDKQGEPAPHQEHTIGAELAVADIRVGKDLNGHKGIVHGGIISLLIDDTFGWGYEAMGRLNGKSFGDEDFPIVVTANLNVDFRIPLPANSHLIIRVYHEKTDRRKIYFSARVKSHDGSALYCEAKSLFVMLKHM
jgi:acyl-coenzyme A thioesterase PaaI-like protein